MPIAATTESLESYVVNFRMNDQVFQTDLTFSSINEESDLDTAVQEVVDILNAAPGVTHLTASKTRQQKFAITPNE